MGPPDVDKVILNFSNHMLLELEKLLLFKVSCLKFAVEPKNINHANFFPPFYIGIYFCIDILRAF